MVNELIMTLCNVLVTEITIRNVSRKTKMLTLRSEEYFISLLYLCFTLPPYTPHPSGNDPLKEVIHEKNKK